MVDGGHVFKGHVAGALDGPFDWLFLDDGANQVGGRVPVGKDAVDVGTPIDPTVQLFNRVGPMQLGLVVGRKVNASRHVVLGAVH